jgi:hypothetical protein
MISFIALGPGISPLELDPAPRSEAQQPTGGLPRLPQTRRFWPGKIFRITNAAIHTRGRNTLVQGARASFWSQTVRNR